MYLEGLDIHGFKSFGKKTKFKFTDGMTAIVGPNGCGKSNVVDAIRWVLGEQKAGIIRSDRMENVIFNGSKSIKPLGMAEVSLTIQNTKNVLPIEYSEVVITRRLFRSLESQYLLNHAPCRLKDIQNLFMDTGMGPDAYSIIELSMVESILNGKADDRRRIFEEAAGVTKYKMRRKAAFRKLEATAADILRLDDIISEVEKNVSSLQRQVRKARRYQELKEILKEKEIKLATHEYSKIKSELEPLIENLQESQNRRAELTAKYDEKEAQIEEARLKLLEIERSLSTKQKELNEVSSKIHRKEEEILVDRERRKALEERKTRLMRDKEEINSRIEKTKEQIVHFQESLQQLFEKIQLAEDDFHEKNASLKALENKVHDKREKLKAIENERLQAAEGISNSKQEEERIKTQLENIEERIAAITREFEENELLEKIRQDKIEKIVDDKSSAESELKNLGQRHEIIQKNIQKLEEEKEAAKEGILNRRGELQTLKERIDLLKKFIESYEDHPEGVQFLLLQGHLNGGCKGTVGDVLTVDSDYRKAIETALGEAAVSLIVEETEQALQCIELLKSQDKGPVTFFPLDRFANGNKSPSKGRLSIEGTDGVIDWADRLVKCNSDFQPVVESLLGDYLIVSDMETARKHATKLRKHRISLITLNGETVSTWGPIKGGKNGSTEAGVVGRKALVEELTAKTDDVSKQLQAEDSRHEELKNKYQQQCEAEVALTKEMKSVESKLSDLEIQLAQLEFESRKEVESRERLQKERDTHLESREVLEEKIQSIAPSLEELKESRAQTDAALLEVSNELQELETQLDGSRAVVQDSRVKLVDLKSEERHLQDNIAKQQEYEKELADSIVRIDDEMKSASEEYAELESRIDANKKAVQIDFDHHKELETDVNRIEQEYLEDKEKLDEKEKSIKGVRNERDQLSETLHSMELRVSELKMNAEKIEERIKEEYEVQITKEAIDEELDSDALFQEIDRVKNRLHSMEPVNLLALKEFEKEKSRLDFLNQQKSDLQDAELNLNETIRVINKTAREQFSKVFSQVRENFIEVFKGFFENGQADLKLTSNEDPLEAEIIIEADPKGRRIGALSLLSGGEKALTAISILFAIYLVKPSPFCILDEVDAPLDDANVGRFIRAIHKFAANTQFIIVTHNKLTMRAADCLYGITMEEEGVSKVVSVNFKDMDVEIAPQAA